MGTAFVAKLTRQTRGHLAQVVVGDEILAARVEDVNTRFLCGELRALGWRVCKVRRICAANPGLPCFQGPWLCLIVLWEASEAGKVVIQSPL